MGGKKPNMFDFLGVLNNLEAVRIRASFTDADETFTLTSASITAGKKWNPCCTLDDTVDMCVSKGSSYYNPDTLKFYCEGSQAKPVRVKTVTPRFARRTGGAKITVTGDNFGLPGSTPIISVGGRMCQRTEFVDDAYSGSVKGPVLDTTLICTTPVNEGFDKGVVVQANSGSTDSPYQVRQAADRTRWENKGTTATSCNSDDTHGFEFASHDFTWLGHTRLTRRPRYLECTSPMLTPTRRPRCAPTTQCASTSTSLTSMAPLCGLHTSRAPPPLVLWLLKTSRLMRVHLR